MSEQDRHIGLEEASDILRRRQLGIDKLHHTKDGKLHVDHVAAANAMVMYIVNLPIDAWIKKIMVMRIGAPLINKAPMSAKQVALALGMYEQEVIECEQEGFARYRELYHTHILNRPIPKLNASAVKDALNIVNQQKSGTQK